ncbi:latrophilin Cirl-like [Ostrea edulis]|uniref:latrophilin Cirl-like n=1 Tax=Ostrea edulis TaxID=37623 RepID=UPI0024AFCD0D|nr:latrophilin Cirl-like [Ostrea edulis]
MFSLEKTCYQGWVFHGSQCYKSFREARPWREARDQCRLFPHGDLACFDTAGDQHLVQAEVISDMSEGYWIGLQGNDTYWKWTTGNDISSFSSFRGGSRISIGNSTDDRCVMLENNWWSGVPCNNSHYYICQASSLDCHVESGWATTISKHCIKTMASPSGWHDGRNTCRSQGADLARFHTRNELDFLIHNLSLPESQYWIDLGSSGYDCEGINITEAKVDPFYDSCTNNHMFICEISSCASRQDEYGCNAMFCISRNLLCDGRQDCPNGSDESLSLCDKYTTNTDQTESVTEQMTSGITSSPQRREFSDEMAILQCLGRMPEIARKECLKDLPGNSSGIISYIGEITRATNLSERVKVYLDIYNAILSITAENGQYASVNRIMEMSSALEKIEQDLTTTCHYDRVYVENRENIGNITIIIIIIDKNITDNRTTGNVQDGMMRISPVLSLSAFQEGAYLNLEHTFTLSHYAWLIQNRYRNNTNNGTVVCGYIDVHTGSWSYNGCSVLRTSVTNTSCYCNHTTNFAILMQVKDFEMDSIHDTALSVITYVGCTVSLVTQMMAITVFSCVTSLNSERICVHKNLCFAITAAQLVFLTGIKAVQIKIICSVIALLLHYFYSAVFVWMLVEGLLLYSKVVQVFGTEKSRIAYYYAFGWGLPLVLVVTSATANWKGYGTSRSCWLSTTDGTIWSFTGPAVSVIVVNVVILWLVMRVILSLERSDESRQIKSGVKGAMFLLPLLGLTWIFGLLAVNEDTIIFQYLFAIFNSLQGFFIFLFHCVCNSEVRQALGRMREKIILSKGDLVISSDIQTQSDTTFPANERNIPRGKSGAARHCRTSPRVQMTSSTHVSSRENIVPQDALILEDLTRENDLVYV